MGILELGISVNMNPKSNLGSNNGEPPRVRKRGSEGLNDNGNTGSFRRKIHVIQPPNHLSFLPEITHQALLDTSDPESERPVSTGDENNRAQLSPNKARVSCHNVDPPRKSPGRSSNSESFKSDFLAGPSSSSSRAPGKGLRFVPTPHPDMIHLYSSGSESVAGSSSSRNPDSSRFPTSHICDNIYDVKIPSVEETRESNAPGISGHIPSSLLDARFIFRTSSQAKKMGKSQECGSLDDSSGSGENLRNRVNLQQSIGAASITTDHATTRIYEDGCGGTRSLRSFSNVGQFPVGNSSNQSRSSQPVPLLVTNVKCEPAECSSRIDSEPAGCSSRTDRNTSRGPSSNSVDQIGYACPTRAQQGLVQTTHQTSETRLDEVGFDHTFSARSAGASVISRNLQPNSHLDTRPAPSTTSFAHSDNSYLRSVGSGNRDSSVPSSNVQSMARNRDSSNQDSQIASESRGTGFVVMSLVHKKNKIAGSCYNSSTGQVQLLETVTDNFEFCTTVLALRSITPSIVVVPSAGAPRFLKELSAKIEGDQAIKDCQFLSLPPRYFAYSFARRTILESALWEGCLTFRSEDAKKNAIVSNINLNDERLVCAFGGLLYHLSTGTPHVGVGMSPSPITSIQHMKLSNKLWLDSESFKNLQIFDPADHPSSFKWSSANRDDGKGMFGFFERFCSAVGMTKLRSFLANPVNCRTTIKERHEVINFFLDPGNFNAVEALRSFASQMSSSSVIMGYLSSPTLRGGHWKHIYRHIYYTVSYAEVCHNHGDQSRLLRELGSTIVDAVYSMAHNLERVIDLVNMENNETFVIKYGFHPPLDAAKEKFSRLKVAMDKVTPYEFDSVPPFISRIQMMYIPEMKFLLSIPFWAPDLSKEELILPNLEFKFSANKTAFYKTRRCYELDELLGDAQTDIINEESMIIQSLRNYLKKHMHHIVRMTQKIAEIECIFALAKVAREERYAKPEILDNCEIHIHGGWHPLLDVPSSEVIKNDTVSSVDTSLVKLIYGPNGSGKSIYLKQVGLIMYLVHIGSYVPAVSAKVGLFGKILARTTSEESITSLSSTMLSELKKIQDAVTGCAKDTLLILDEVGKGSIETNCIAIVASTVNYCLSQGSDCPHVLMSTHLSGINDFVTPPPHSDGRNLFEMLIMDYALTEGELVFLFSIRRCDPNASFVFEVLENSEFAAPIVKTTRTVLEALRTGENFLPYCETRIQRSHKYLNFIRKFVNIDMAKPGYLEKLQNKIQRYYEKPSY